MTALEAQTCLLLGRFSLIFELLTTMAVILPSNIQNKILNIQDINLISRHPMIILSDVGITLNYTLCTFLLPCNKLRLIIRRQINKH